MNRTELIRAVASDLRERGVRKPVSAYKQVLHISDDDGNTKDLVIKKPDKGVLFTTDDIETIMDTFIEVIENALKQGDCISVRGFGTLALHFRKARRTKHPETGDSLDIPEHYIPKFTFGKDLKTCAKIFEISLNENTYGDDLFYSEDESEE